MASKWIAYNDLSWTEDWLTEPADYEDEVTINVELIKQYSAEPPDTLLHMGSGAGGHDWVFKRSFTVTGVDISPGMLEKAQATHPDIEYLEGDMRTLRLNRLFDAVAIPDVLGLFSLATWHKVFNDAGLTIQRLTLDYIYDQYLLGDGEYPMTIFIGQKT